VSDTNDNANIQLLKSRNDSAPFRFRRIPATQSGDFDSFELVECQHSDNESLPPEWWRTKDKIRPNHLRERIEPWLTALFQSEHFSLLVGSGLTHAVYHMATDQAMPGMETVSFNVFQEEIQTASELSAANVDRGSVNIEDQIRVANELLKGIEYLTVAKKGRVLKLLIGYQKCSFLRAILACFNKFRTRPQEERLHLARGCHAVKTRY